MARHMILKEYSKIKSLISRSWYKSWFNSNTIRKNIIKICKCFVLDVFICQSTSSMNNPYQSSSIEALPSADFGKRTISWPIAVLSAVPAVCMAVLYYSLAIHMYNSLGGWPDSLGNKGFPTALNYHAEIAFGLFSILFLLVVFVIPIALVVCSLIPRCQPAFICLEIFLISCLACVGLMILAPDKFQFWWWD